jgi:hypothetical protein
VVDEPDGSADGRVELGDHDASSAIGLGDPSGNHGGAGAGLHQRHEGVAKDRLDADRRT